MKWARARAVVRRHGAVELSGLAGVELDDPGFDRRISYNSRFVNITAPSRSKKRASRSADFQVCRTAGFQIRTPFGFAQAAGWEISDTAGLETCATRPDEIFISGSGLFPARLEQSLYSQI